MTLKKRILLTGGSGKAGKHVAKQLLDKGHRVLNCDLVNHQQEGLDYLHLDVLMQVRFLTLYRVILIETD